MIPTDFHGSDIDAVAEYFHVDPTKMVSFAANVNPLGISPKLREQLSTQLDVISSYPERDYRTLRGAIGTYVDADSEHIIVGNGSTELISGVIKSVCPKDAILISPTYSEYEREIHLCGGQLRYFYLEEEKGFVLNPNDLFAFFQDNTDMVILCNPNNPTSNAVDVETLREILTECKKRNIIMMIDETYIEFSDAPVAIEAIPLTEEFDNLVVLRGISKFFAAPGLRLGYAVMNNPEIQNNIMEHKDPWTINSLAAKAGEIMFTDEEYIQGTKQFITNEKDKMTKTLTDLNVFKVYPSDSNFLLVKIVSDAFTATELFAECAKNELMIRDCTNFNGLGSKFIRICMMSEEDNQRLMDAIANFVKKL